LWDKGKSGKKPVSDNIKRHGSFIHILRPRGLCSSESLQVNRGLP
jgi:hypothetical protein